MGKWALKAGRGSCCDDRGSLCLALLMVLLTGSLRWIAFVVSLKLLWGEGVVWLVQVDEGVMEGDVFGSLSQAAWGGRGRDTEGIYVQVSNKIGYLEFQDP